MLEVPQVVAEVAVVGDADQAAQLELVHAGFLLHLAEGGHLDVLAGLLVAFGQVPEAAAGDQEVVAAAVGHQAAGRIDLLEFGAEAAVGPLGVVRGDVDALQGVLHLEHPHEGVDVQLVPEVEFDRIRIRKGLVVRGADDDASFPEIYLVHNICYICVLQR